MKKMILTICLLVGASILLASCQIKSSAWDLVISGDFLRTHSVNPVDGSIAVVDWENNQVLYISQEDGKFSRPEKLAAPTQDGIQDVCITDRLWLVTVSGDVFGYDRQAQSWVSQTENRGPHCYVTNTGSLIVWGGDWIRAYSGSWSASLAPPQTSYGNDLNVITQDGSGVLWLASQDNLYQQTGEGQWRSIANFNLRNARILFFAFDGILWIGTAEKLYTWDMTDQQPSLLWEESSFLDSPVYLFEDNQNTIWLVSTKNIWVQRDGEFQAISAPFGDNSITEASYDRIRNRLYVILSLDGVFSFDITDQQ